MKKPVVLIVGASADRNKFGNKSLRAHAQCGYEAVPIHPSTKEIEGLPCLASVSQYPGPVDRVSMYVPPAIGMKLLEEIAAKKPKEVWFNPGSESMELIDRARQLGLASIVGCSIVDLGVSPADFP